MNATVTTMECQRIFEQSRKGDSRVNPTCKREVEAPSDLLEDPG